MSDYTIEDYTFEDTRRKTCPTNTVLSLRDVTYFTNGLLMDLRGDNNLYGPHEKRDCWIKSSLPQNWVHRSFKMIPHSFVLIWEVYRMKPQQKLQQGRTSIMICAILHCDSRSQSQDGQFCSWPLSGDYEMGQDVRINLYVSCPATKSNSHKRCFVD